MSLGIHPTSASYAATKASVSDAEKNDSETLVLEFKETCRDVLENLEHVGIRMSAAMIRTPSGHMFLIYCLFLTSSIQLSMSLFITLHHLYQAIWILNQQ